MSCNKQLKNMAEAAQPVPPHSSVFVSFIRKALNKDGNAATEDAIFGDAAPRMQVGKPKGTAKNEINGLRTALQYDAMCRRTQPELDMDLDAWFAAWQSTY